MKLGAHEGINIPERILMFAKRYDKPENVYTADDFTLNWCFGEYYRAELPAENVLQVEHWCKNQMDEYFSDEEVREDEPDGYLAYRIPKMKLEELPEAMVSKSLMIRRLAIKRLLWIKYGIEYKKFYIDVWNFAWCDNGESHGTVFAMCFKSVKKELRDLGFSILADLMEIQGTADIDFDT